MDLADRKSERKRDVLILKINQSELDALQQRRPLRFCRIAQLTASFHTVVNDMLTFRQSHRSHPSILIGNLLGSCPYCIRERAAVSAISTTNWTPLLLLTTFSLIDNISKEEILHVFKLNSLGPSTLDFLIQRFGSSWNLYRRASWNRPSSWARRCYQNFVQDA